MEIRLLQRDDLDLLLATDPGLFDEDPKPQQAQAFLESDLHLMVAALEHGQIVSFASGTILLHPDKTPCLFVNEVATRDSHLRQGLARRVLETLLDAGRAHKCKGAWLATEPDNAPALALYRGLGADEQVLHGFAWDGAFE